VLTVVALEMMGILPRTFPHNIDVEKRESKLIRSVTHRVHCICRDSTDR
jgi:hypothetical protein